MRVTPEEYGAVAADLRRVDGAEQEEIPIPISGATTRGVGTVSGAAALAGTRARCFAAASVVAAAAACTSPAPGGPSGDRLAVARPTDAVSLDPARTATSNRWRSRNRSTAVWSASRPAASSPNPIWRPAGR